MPLIPSLTALLARIPTLGQKNKAGSTPVTIASDQDIATSAKQDAGNASAASIDSKTPSLLINSSATINVADGTGGGANPTAGSFVVIAAPGSKTAVVSVGAGLVGTLVPEVLAADGVTWEASMLRDPDGNPITAITNPATLAAYVFPGVGARAGGRLRCTARTGGSCAVSMVATDHTLYFQPAEPVAVAADGEANTSKLKRVVTRLTGYNGTTFDMLRTGLAGFASGVLATPTGAQQSLPIAQYRANNITLTDTQWASLQATLQGFLKVADQYQLAGENGGESNLATALNPLGSNTNALTNVVSTALENSHVLIAAAGKLYAFDGAHHTASLSNNISLAATTNAFQATFDGLRAVGFTVSGTWTGTLVFEGSADNGVTWDSVGVQPSTGGPSGAVVTSTTVNGSWFLASTQAGAYTLLRVRCSVTGTGTATAQLHSVSLILYLQFFNTTTVPADTAVPFDVMPLSCFEPVPLKSVMAFFGRYQSTGGSFALSTTAATKTIANGAGGFFDTGLRPA